VNENGRGRIAESATDIAPHRGQLAIADYGGVGRDLLLVRYLFTSIAPLSGSSRLTVPRCSVK
jgi:hypothetical protein